MELDEIDTSIAWYPLTTITLETCCDRRQACSLSSSVGVDGLKISFCGQGHPQVKSMCGHARVACRLGVYRSVAGCMGGEELPPMALQRDSALSTVPREESTTDHPSECRGVSGPVLLPFPLKIDSTIFLRAP